MGQYTKLKEELIKYRNECKKEIEKLEQSISKYQYYKRIYSFLDPNLNTNKLSDYYSKKEKTYELPDIIMDICILGDILSIINNPTETIPMHYLEIKFAALDCIKSSNKSKYFNKIMDIFAYRNIKRTEKKLVSTAENIYKNLTEEIIDDLNEELVKPVLFLKEYVRQQKEDINIDEVKQTKENLNSKVLKMNRYISMICDDELKLSFSDVEEYEEFLSYLKEINFYEIDFDELKEELIRNFKETKQKNFEQEIRKSLNEEELKIYDSIIELVNNVENDMDLMNSDKSSKLNGSFSLENRKKLYGRGSSIDLAIIVNDIKSNLVPNLILHKPEILGIFEYILNIYAEYVTNESKKEELQEIYFQFRKNLKKNKNVIDYYKQLSQFNKGIFDKILEEIKHNNMGTFSFMKDHFSKPYEFYKLFNILREIEFNIELFDSVINKSIIPEDEYKDLLEIAEDILTKYDEIDYEENFDKKIEYAQNHEFKGKTLVGFMNYNFENYNNEQKKILQRVLIKIFEKSWMEYFFTSHENEFKPILYRKRNGKVVKLKASGFDVSRIRINKYRIGVIQINVCKENNEKLQKKYNLTGPFIILLEPFEIVGADHNKYYEYIVDVINNNKKELENIVNLFSNPETKEEDLFKIIESGILTTKKILNKKIVSKEEENIK